MYFPFIAASCNIFVKPFVTNFQPLEGLEKILSGGVNSQRARGGDKFSEGTRFSRATVFFYKRVIYVTTLLLIIHTITYNSTIILENDFLF